MEELKKYLIVTSKDQNHLYMFLSPTDLKKMMERHSVLWPDLQTKGILLLGGKEMQVKSNREELKKKNTLKLPYMHTHF